MKSVFGSNPSLWGVDWHEIQPNFRPRNDHTRRVGGRVGVCMGVKKVNFFRNFFYVRKWSQKASRIIHATFFAQIRPSSPSLDPFLRHIWWHLAVFRLHHAQKTSIFSKKKFDPKRLPKSSKLSNSGPTVHSSELAPPSGPKHRIHESECALELFGPEARVRDLSIRPSPLLPSLPPFPTFFPRTLWSKQVSK